MTDHHELARRHRAVMPSWQALYYDQPIELVSGQGRHVVDGEGNRYLDFFGGILTTMTAHSLPEVVEAVREQAGRMLHTSTLYLIRPAVELAELIATLVPMERPKVFFCTSGSEANEAAMLIASTVRRSTQVLALRNSYHGRSFATMAVTGNRGWSASALSPFQVSYVHNGDSFRTPALRGLSDHEVIEACVDDLRHVIATATSGDVACLIAEPVQGVGGFAMPPDGMFGAMADVLDEHGILLIDDEVQTGWGRTGDHFWGMGAHDVVPDLITFAKGVGNGLTLAGVVGPAELMDSVEASSISTFGGNPLSTAGGLANLRYLLDHDLQSNSREMGRRLLDGLRPLGDRCSIVGDVRGKGLMVGVELVEADGFTANPKAAAQVLEECRQRGVLVGKGGLYGNCVRVAPPMTVTSTEVDEAVGAIVDSVETADGGGA